MRVDDFSQFGCKVRLKVPLQFYNKSNMFDIMQRVLVCSFGHDSPRASLQLGLGGVGSIDAGLRWFFF